MNKLIDLPDVGIGGISRPNERLSYQIGNSHYKKNSDLIEFQTSHTVKIDDRYRISRISINFERWEGVDEPFVKA